MDRQGLIDNGFEVNEYHIFLSKNSLEYAKNEASKTPMIDEDTFMNMIKLEDEHKIIQAHIKLAKSSMAEGLRFKLNKKKNICSQCCASQQQLLR